MNRRPIILFLLAQLLLPVLLPTWPGTLFDDSVLLGILAGQTALLGVGLGVGNASLGRRIGATIICAIILCFFALTRSSNGWIVVLLIPRALILAAYFLRLRRKRGLVLGRSDEIVEGAVLRISIKQLMILITSVAIVFAILRADYDSLAGPAYDVFLVVMTLMLGIGNALVPLVAATAAFAEREKTKTGVVAVLAVLAIVAAMAGFAYSQTDNWMTAARWIIGSLVEALVVAASIIALRQLGYRLTKTPKPN